MQMQEIERFAGVGRDLNPGAFEGLDLIFVRAADPPAPLRRVAVFQVDADLHGSPPTDTICLASGRFLCADCQLPTPTGSRAQRGEMVSSSLRCNAESISGPTGSPRDASYASYSPGCVLRIGGTMR